MELKDLLSLYNLDGVKLMVLGSGNDQAFEIESIEPAFVKDEQGKATLALVIKPNRQKLQDIVSKRFIEAYWEQKTQRP